MLLKFEEKLFQYRKSVLVLFISITLLMGFSLSKISIQADFSKLLPLEHEYIKTYLQYRQDFSGANRVLVAVMAKDGDMFDADFFRTLQEITNEVFFIEGIDRAKVYSLFTPNVRFTEVVEDGIAGGNVIPDDFNFSETDLQQVRENILKSDIRGRLVANDFSGAMVSAEIMNVGKDDAANPNYGLIAKTLENNIRQKYENDDIAILIIGYPMVVGEVIKASKSVLLLFLLTVLIIYLLLVLFSQSIKLATIPLISALMAVLWQLGLLPILGVSIDPMLLIVPFLIFAIAVSHSVQLLNHFRLEYFKENIGVNASRFALRRLVKPGMIALISDAIGFLVMININVGIIQQTAIIACLGVLIVLLINLLFLPVLLSYFTLDNKNMTSLEKRQNLLNSCWHFLSNLTRKSFAAPVLITSVFVLVSGFTLANKVSIGDSQDGVPELHFDSRYNKDTREIVSGFSIGSDFFIVIAETAANGCIDHKTLQQIDHFAWTMLNMSVVESVTTLPFFIRQLNAGWNEGNLKWRNLPVNSHLLAQSVAFVPTSSGLLNNDCTAIPIVLYANDHKAETINLIIANIEQYIHQYEPDINFRLASGNMGVIGAKNQVIDEAQFPVFLYVFAGVICLCLLCYGRILFVVTIVYPLLVVSVLAYSLMYVLSIGLTVYTLPVIALGVGIGVDYGLYFYNSFIEYKKENVSLQFACQQAFSSTGISILFTSLILTSGVVVWLFSPLKFQADIGIILAFMFLANMLATLLLIPSIQGQMKRQIG